MDDRKAAPGHKSPVSESGAPTPAGTPIDGNGPASMPALDEESRSRGRRLAISSHPLGMTFTMVFSQHLPTLALVSLGASETWVGLQNALGPALQPLQLPTLRRLGRVAKRRILVAGHGFALLAALPLVFFSRLEELGGSLGIAVALASLAAVAGGLVVSNTVWFPLLRGYVEPARIGRFFGTIRSGWHLALIVYYLIAQRWLAAHPGDFGPLFALGWLCGVARTLLIARLPERSERTGEHFRVREAWRLVQESRDLRRYLAGVTGGAAIRFCVVPFAIVMLRREIGFSDSQVLLTTAALFAGGLASLYLWGRVVDRIGAAPVFRWTAIGLALLYLSLLGFERPDTGTLVAAVAFFFFFSVLSAGFGVADTHVLFGLTPPEAPARTLVIAAVFINGVAGAAPLLVGLGLERWLDGSDDPIGVYRSFFVMAALAQALVFLPLRRFRSEPRDPDRLR